MMEEMITSLRGTLDTGQLPQGWKSSMTRMIPKVTKPKAKKPRPIALTNQGCKLMMGVVRMYLEENIKKN